MSDQVIVYLRDFDNDVVSTGIPTASAATPAQRQDVVDAIQIWSIGANDGADAKTQIEPRVGSAATTSLAQGGEYAYMEFKDSVTGTIFRERLPMPDLGKADDIEGDPAWVSQGSGSSSLTVMNTAHADYATLKANLEAAYESPNGNSGTLERVYIPDKY